MDSLNKIIRIISLVGAFVLTITTVRAVDPPPDGGYPGNNTAEGDNALLNLTSNGLDNTAVGYYAMAGNTTGSLNTAVGSGTLFSNDVGNFNVGVGAQALYENKTGTNNTALGAPAMRPNTSGSRNTAVGSGALGANTIGNENTCVGESALLQSTGSDNIAVGSNAGLLLTSGSNNIDLGSNGIAGESNTIRIGTTGIQTATFVAGIKGTAITGVAVGITADGQLGVKASSARFKESIRAMDKASEAILALRPVTFHYKKELDPKGERQFGLVAEEVVKVNPDLVVSDDTGKPFSVRYEEVNAMLLNEFLKEHRRVEEQARINQKQESTIEQQQKQIQTLTVALKAQGEQIQKVSDQLKARPIVVVKN